MNGSTVLAARSPLHTPHKRLGGRFFTYAGWLLPPQMGYTLWGRDLDREKTPLEADLGHATPNTGDHPEVSVEIRETFVAARRVDPPFPQR